MIVISSLIWAADPSAKRKFAAAGGLISYGGSVTDAFRQVGVYTGRVLAPLPRELRAFLDVGPGGVRGKEAEGLLGPATFAINNDAAVAASLARVAMLDLRVNEC